MRDEPLSTPSSALIREPSFNYKILPEVILTHSVLSARKRLFALALSLLVLLAGAALHAQATGSVDGTILDVQGKGVFNAAVTVKNSATVAARTARADATGHYSVDGLPTGSYTVEASASGFATGSKTGVVLAAGQTQHASFVLSITSVAEQITVNAGIDSIAAQTAPSGGFIEERSAQSLISNSYIRNFTSPIADYGEIVQIVPGAFTISSDGVGLGQSKTYFRGFPDGDFDIDFDGIPFYDTNSPTHHSWAFFPAQWDGGVDFDRSPGSASTIGPTPFGGSIHLLSMPLSSEEASSTRAAPSPTAPGTPSCTTAHSTLAVSACLGAPRSRISLSTCTT